MEYLHVCGTILIRKLNLKRPLSITESGFSFYYPCIKSGLEFLLFGRRKQDIV
jgi:hypothetical protein